MNTLDNDKIRQLVRERYAEIASSASVGCGCAPSCCSPQNASSGTAPINPGYSVGEIASVPDGANMGLGCGNPHSIAALKPGEIVLDLGSGGGFDCFLAAPQVGDAGFVIGVDMTPDMVNKAKDYAKQGAYRNVDFRLGEIEHLPVADNSVDVIISNCVVNLSPDKAQVFTEAYRVLKPGGRLAISDIVATANLPDDIKNDFAKYAGCISGSVKVEDLEAMLMVAGFTDIEIELRAESSELIREWFPKSGAEKYVAAATIRARKKCND